MSYTKKWTSVSQVPNLINSYDKQALPYSVGEMVVCQTLLNGGKSFLSEKMQKLKWSVLFKPFFIIAEHVFFHLEINKSSDSLEIKGIYVINMDPVTHARLMSISASTDAHIELSYFSPTDKQTPKRHRKFSKYDRKKRDNTDVVEPVKNYIRNDSRLNHVVIYF